MISDHDDILHPDCHEHVAIQRPPWEECKQSCVNGCAAKVASHSYRSFKGRTVDTVGEVESRGARTIGC